MQDCYYSRYTEHLLNCTKIDNGLFHLYVILTTLIEISVFNFLGNVYLIEQIVAAFCQSAWNLSKLNNHYHYKWNDIHSHEIEKSTETIIENNTR